MDDYMAEAATNHTSTEADEIHAAILLSHEGNQRVLDEILARNPEAAAAIEREIEREIDQRSEHPELESSVCCVQSEPPVRRRKVGQPRHIIGRGQN